MFENLFQPETSSSAVPLKVRLILYLVGLFVGVGGIGLSWWLLKESTKPDEFIVFAGSESLYWVVNVAGAVEQPGVYLITEGDRLGMAIQQAGGFAQSADDYYIQKNVNLAQQLSDGEKIYIPTKTELALLQTAELVSPIETENGGPSTEANSLISINSATQSELETLTGIGQVRAAEIMANRPYATLEELVSKKIITQALFNQIETEIQL